MVIVNENAPRSWMMQTKRMKLFLPFPNGFDSLVDSFLNRTYVTHAIVSPNDDTSYVDNNVIELTTHHNVRFFYFCTNSN